MSVIFKTHVLESNNILTISAFAAFSFKLEEPRLLSEQDLWKVVKANLGKHESLDLGTPKPRSEYLVYGKAYSQKPVTGMSIYVSIGELSKSLIVIGNRHWAMLGASSPEPFTHIDVNYSNAFGGAKYEYNPVGKGRTQNSKGQIDLPNIEDPNNPITHKADKPAPAGFTAYPTNWPQRLKYLGPINSKYLKESWPHLPKGTNPEFFNTAPMDQRLVGYFSGNENFTIKNMHPINSTQNSKLPGLRVRLFITQKNSNNQELFKEISNNIETLWLFPNNEVGILVYRGSINITDKEYTNIKELYALWEPLNEAPKSAEFYLQQLLNNSIKPTEVAITDEVAEPEFNSINTPETNADGSSNPDPYIKPQSSEELEKALKDLEELKLKFQNQLKQSGINLDDEVQKVMQASEAPTKEPRDISHTLKDMQELHTNMMKKHGITQADLDKVLAKSHTPDNELSIAEALLKFKQSGSKLTPEIEENLLKLDEWVTKAKLEVDELTSQIKPNRENKDEVKPEEPPLEPVLTAKELTRIDVINKYNINKDLSNLDLSNLDLSNLNLENAKFTSSILENTNFENSKLDKATFTSSRLNNANFTNSILNETIFTENYAASVNFSKVSLIKSQIKHSDFTGSNFENANLKEVIFIDVILEQSNFENVLAINSYIENSMLNGSNLTYANLSNATFKNTNLSETKLDKTNLSKITAPELKLNGAQGDSTNFEAANLNNSRADQITHFTNINLKSADINNGAWSGAILTQANLYKANLDNANFSNTTITKSKLELVTAKNANFSGATLNDSDLNRINLFKGSMRNCNLSGVDLRYSNLYGVDFYKAVLNKTNFIGANIDRTLFSVLEISRSELSIIE